jgi:protein-L-isoaspartate(D-aspartate) O-methyltransferase
VPNDRDEAKEMNQQNFAAMREAMVANQLRTVAVNDPRVIVALKSVAREAYVPADRAQLAYIDGAIPLGNGRALNTPLATARLITAAHAQPGERVLLIGAATGYAAAVLAELGAHVTALEEDDALAAAARANLARYTDVRIVTGALAKGSLKHGPYSVILVDGAVHHLPDTLVAQLAVGGKLVSGVVDNGVTRLASGCKTSGGFGLEPFLDAACVILPGFNQPEGFRF